MAFESVAACPELSAIRFPARTRNGIELQVDRIGARGIQASAQFDVGNFAVDLLNRSLLSDFLAVQGLRGLGLYVLDRIGPLRRAAMREGVAPRTGIPALMREASAS